MLLRLVPAAEHVPERCAPAVLCEDLLVLLMLHQDYGVLRRSNDRNRHRLHGLHGLGRPSGVARMR
jgi:hypothetical protein